MAFVISCPALAASRLWTLVYTAANAKLWSLLLSHHSSDHRSDLQSCQSARSWSYHTDVASHLPQPASLESLYAAPCPSPQRVIIERLPQDFQFYSPLPKRALPLLYQRRAPRQFFSLGPFVTHCIVSPNYPTKPSSRESPNTRSEASEKRGE